MNITTKLIGLLMCIIYSSAFGAEEGELAPDFTLPSIYENQPSINLENLRGKTVYIDFWASWCAPCLRSMPLYNELYSRYKDEGLEILAINVDNPIEDGLDFLADTPLDFLIPSDLDGDVSELFEVIGMPSSYLVDADGTVRLVHMGFRDGDLEVIETAIQASLAER